MSIDIGIVVVGEAAPSGSVTSDPSMADWLWFQPSTDTWHKYNGSTWVAVAAPSHGHGGVTGEFEGTFKKIKIENGIVTEFELE